MKTHLPFQYVDLTHTLSPNTPAWDVGCGFEKTILVDYKDCAADETKFRIHKLIMRAGIGTHIDAPSHCIPQGLDIHKLALEHLIAPAIVIDASDRATERSLLTAGDVYAFEKSHGTIPAGCFVIVYTGWERYWNQPEKYRNNLLFPSVSVEAAQLLCERKLVGLGIDTLSPDRDGIDFPVHRLLLGNGKYIVENVANAKELPPVGAYTFTLPMKIEEATEAPVRLIGVMKCGLRSRQANAASRTTRGIG